MIKFPISVAFVLAIFLHISLKSCSACNGYVMNLISVENCGSDNIVTVDRNYSAILTSDCFLSTVGCIRSKGFKKAIVDYTISKDGNDLLHGSPDICNLLDEKSSEQKSKLEMFGFPTECPVPKGVKCTDGSKKVNISKYKSLLPMAVGRITAKYDVTHEMGKTCAVVKFEIKHKRS